jgi:Protein of unknown function (DUF992)
MGGKIRIIARLAAFLLTCLPWGVDAQTRVAIGTLSCNIPFPNRVIPLAQELDGKGSSISCTFNRAPELRSTARVETYKGLITALDLQFNRTSESFMKWTVYAPIAMGPKGLAGIYYRRTNTTVEARIEALGGNALFGGFVALQPFSTSGALPNNLKFNFAVAVTTLQLN